MNEGYGNDFISISDDEGNEYELEHLDTFDFEGSRYMALLPADMDEDDEDYGIVILKVVEEDGEEILSTPDSDEEAERAYDVYMQRVFAEEDDGEEE